MKSELSLTAVARAAGSLDLERPKPGACAPGFMLSSASRTGESSMSLPLKRFSQIGLTVITQLKLGVNEIDLSSRRGALPAFTHLR